jgi:hypothetical protein
MMAWGMEDDLATTVRGMEFISWLRQSHPELDISANVPTEEIRKLAGDFCTAKNYQNCDEFATTVLAWLSGRGSSKIRAKLEELGTEVKTRNKHSRTEVSPFARYSAMPYHGIFLFLAMSDFPGFIHTYWEDLNSLTGDLLDVYYSAEDLERRVSAFDVIQQFRSLKVDRTALPALLLWKQSLVESCVIPLQNLAHQDIFDVVALVVQRVDEGKAMTAIQTDALAEVARRTNATLPQILIQHLGDNITVGNVTGNQGNVAIGKDLNIGTGGGQPL